LPVDPQIQVLLDRGAGVPATHTLPVAVARTQYEARIALMAPPAEIAGAREQTIDGPGGPLRIRLYTPRGKGPFPLLVFFHGSGFVLCSLDTHDGMCRNLCAGAGCVVASVDYRLAPEHKFPAAVEDVVVVTREVMRRDPARPLALSGDSAGGNLAINAIVETGAKPVALALQSPFVDLSMTAPSIDARAALDPFMSREGLGADVGRYLPPGTDIAAPRLSPLFATLAALPPTLIQVGTAEILFDDATRLAVALQAAGVPVICERWLDMTHDWHLFPNWLPSADAATRSIAKFLRQHANA
jgi:acetyl esterase